MKLTEKIFQTPKGDIHYWRNEGDPERPTLVFLPGLTADHRLFDRQIEYFAPRHPVLTWDAPGHGASRPFTLEFSLMDKARWLHELLKAEGISRPVIVGQSMGGYVGQAFSELYPSELAGFVSIDSAPLQRQYITAAEIWMLKHVGPVYRMYPWNALKRTGAKGCAESDYGRALMAEMMESYSHKEYCDIAAHGFRILGEAMEANLPYALHCPAMLICGEKDKAGSAKHYNKVWAKKSGIPFHWIKGAGHNSNTDCPDEVNHLIEQFVDSLSR